MLRRRFAAAWRAFRDPSLLDPQPIAVVIPEPVLSVAPTEPVFLPPAPEREHGRFRVYHHDPVTMQDTMLYPEWPGQDSGAEARKVFEQWKPTYAGEYIKFVDGGIERGRKGGGA